MINNMGEPEEEKAQPPKPQVFKIDLEQVNLQRMLERKPKNPPRQEEVRESFEPYPVYEHINKELRESTEERSRVTIERLVSEPSRRRKGNEGSMD